MRVPLQVRAAAVLELRRRQRQPVPVKVLPPFASWIATARPEFLWTAAHFTHPAGIFPALEAITAGRIRRLILSVSVRHAKTESLVSYLAYRLTHNPKLHLLLGSYNQQQADKVSRQVRRLARAQGVAMSEDRDAAREWETAAGGAMQAVGAGAGVASVNADLIVIDDPIGSRDEAESQVERDRVWDWITSDILARCVPDTAVIISHPRWHTDDPIGRLRDRQAARWTVIDLPGRAEPGDPLGRAEGEPLWPAERGEDWLIEKREELGEYGFASLVQGRPRPREGGMFKWAWWQLLDAVPAQGPMIRYWDTAGTEAKGHGHDPDYTAGALLCRMPDGRTAVVDVARFRHSLARRDAEILAVARLDLARWPGRVAWWFETEAGIQGTERTAEIVRQAQAAGLPVYTEHPTGSKVGRAQPLASAVEAGNVLLCPDTPERPWRDAFRAEAADFPTGAHDDQCLVGETEIVTPWGAARLDGVSPGDVVLGWSGWVKVLAAGRTGHRPVVTHGPLTGTANHPVFADGRWAPLAQVDDTMLVLMLCAQSTDVAAPFSPVVSAGCTTSGSIAAPPSDPPPRCAPSPSRLARWRDVVRPRIPVASATSTTPVGGATETHPPFTPRSAALSGLSQSSSTALPSAATPIRRSPRIASISSREANTSSVAWRRFTARCGSRITALCRKGWTCITSTATQGITPSPTSAFVPRQSMTVSISPPGAHSGDPRDNLHTSPPFAPSPPSGTNRPRAASGTANTPSARGLERDVFNLTTEDGTYFANGVLVHNCDAADGAFAKLATPADEVSFSEWEM